MTNYDCPACRMGLRGHSHKPPADEPPFYGCGYPFGHDEHDGDPHICVLEPNHPAADPHRCKCGAERSIEPPNNSLAAVSPELRALVMKACAWRSEWSEDAELELCDAIDAWTAMYARMPEGNLHVE